MQREISVSQGFPNCVEGEVEGVDRVDLREMCVTHAARNGTRGAALAFLVGESADDVEGGKVSRLARSSNGWTCAAIPGRRSQRSFSSRRSSSGGSSYGFSVSRGRIPGVQREA